MMRRQSNDPTVLQSSSSIALLQERFRQLQRAKEMRKERDLLRGFSMSSTSPETERQQQHEQSTSTWFSHPDLVRPSRPLIGPPMAEKRPEAIGLLHNISPSATAMQSSRCHSETEVDTSLHL